MSTIELVRRQAERLMQACEALSAPAIAIDGQRGRKHACASLQPKTTASEIQRTRGARH